MSWPKLDADHVAVTSEQMSIIEQKLFHSGLPVAALMEKVGLAMAQWIINKRDLTRNGVLVLVGPGHNGGDGLVVARELYLAGIEVEIWCPFPLKKDLTSQHYSHVKWLGIKESEDKPDLNSNVLWIDALFGLGQTRSLPDYIEQLFDTRQKINPGK